MYNKNIHAIDLMNPEQRYQQLFEQMYELCESNNWGDPFSYARSREIHLAGLLGHRVADDYSGADAYDNNNNPVEYKSTIGKKTMRKNAEAICVHHVFIY